MNLSFHISISATCYLYRWLCQLSLYIRVVTGTVRTVAPAHILYCNDWMITRKSKKLILSSLLIFSSSYHSSLIFPPAFSFLLPTFVSSKPEYQGHLLANTSQHSDNLVPKHISWRSPLISHENGKQGEYSGDRVNKELHTRRIQQDEWINVCKISWLKSVRPQTES